MAISAVARSRIERPRSSATPHSVTTLSTVFFSVVTTSPAASCGTIFEIVAVPWRRVQHDEALSARRVHRAAGEVGLPAARGVVGAVDGLRRALAEQVDGDSVALIDTKPASWAMTRGSFT